MCPISQYSRSSSVASWELWGVPHWPFGGLPYKTDIRIELYGQNYTSRSPEIIFNVWCVSRDPYIVLSNASIPQWPVGSNGVFLSGRLGVSHMMHISIKDYYSQSNTSEPPDMVFNAQCAISPLTDTVPQWPVGSDGAFLTGRLGVSPIRQTSGLKYMVKNFTTRPPRGGFQCLMCFTFTILLSNTAIPRWPVGINGVFLSGRLGVSHIIHISRKDHLPLDNTSGPPDVVFSWESPL